MFEQVFDLMRKATDSTIQLQREMFQRWTSLWPGMPGSQPVWSEQVQQFQKRWAETVSELVKKQTETLEAQFKMGLKNIEDAFRLTEVKDVEELRARTIELWQRSFDCLRQGYETQVRDF